MGDYRLLGLLAEACGHLVAPRPEPAEGTHVLADRERACLAAAGARAEQLGRLIHEATLPDIERAINAEVRELLALREAVRFVVARQGRRAA